MRQADNETQASGTKCAEACWSNYTLCKKNAMKFEAQVELSQERSTLKGICDNAGFETRRITPLQESPWLL
jgi:hypothetical protein